ncbi:MULTISPECIES: HU domain-containing protein [Tenacibaculum]|uniref:HU domain-containing protein n=1 Tax=Tenacibaculum TaxID=104267 RepID=UPI001F0A23BB|nr:MULTISPECIES: SPOR domain-containing protein [Tenacibaculum]MCH3881366.1 SPOR domain-containing protein [Tenacibaculum aquimarinum]MDO6599040.1 SPOR domain-containing protein [Tenacibaculum sp. 1_MG-2023]
MQLANYINDLLYRYDCVIVPNFGGFVTNRIGAKVNNYTHTFYPPAKQITFNAHLKHNDGLLVNYIAKAENISFDAALKTVADFVNNWQTTLKTTSVEVSSVGKLSLNKEQQIVFEPNTTVNYLTESFGLASFESSAIARFKEEVKPLIPVVETTSKDNKKVIPLFVKYAATAAVLLTLGFAGWSGYEQNKQQKHFAKQQQEVAKKIQQATFVIDNPLPTINLNVSKATPKNFHVVAGAFEFPENAEKKVNELKEKGFNAAIIGKNKWGLTQVTFNSFSSKNEAINSLYRIQKTVSKDAWLLVEKAK